MLTDLGASTQLNSLGAFEAALGTSKVAHFTGYTLLDGPIREPTLQAMRAARDAGVRVSLDAADPFVVSQLRDLLWTVLSDFVDIVFLNADEAEGLTGRPPSEAATEIAARAGVPTVAVKLGARGSIVLADGQRYEIPVHLVEARDTTGAGDAYAGGFLYGLVSGWPMAQCGDLASRVAALTVSQVGAVVKDRHLLGDAAKQARTTT